MATGILYHDSFTRHTYPGHPENHQRVQAIMRQLKHEDKVLEKLTPIEAREASADDICIGHSADYIAEVQSVSQRGGGMLDADTYMNEFSYEAAARAVGGTLDMISKIVSNELSNGFALTRPPGHHARRQRGSGFCIFNTVAVAALALRSLHNVERVAILDFDVHHGNGTQAIVEEEPAILYISSHQYPFYPMTGALNSIGSKAAKGTKINLPLPEGTGDEGFQKIYKEIVFPALERFSPDFLLVSAGFDAHFQDPLAGLNITLTTYHWLATQLFTLAQKICQGRLIYCLEGGYNRKVLAFAVSDIFRTLLGDSPAFEDKIGRVSGREPDLSELISTLKALHSL